MALQKCKGIILLFVCLLLLGACNTNYIDREADRREAEKVADQFFEHLYMRDYESTYPLMGKDFFEYTGRDMIKRLHQHAQRKLGAIEGKKLVEWHTFVTEGLKPKADYRLTYLVNHAYHDAKHVLRLQQEEGEIRIIGYYIQSDALKSARKPVRDSLP